MGPQLQIVPDVNGWDDKADLLGQLSPHGLYLGQEFALGLLHQRDKSIADLQGKGV
ncbi:hypothetical protein MBAV_004545 [Candidatus Magnetobacterium bavaricum]|uniref:Uncharacterized protein n=1 Tax=Candidatus Magnetobacterium bavaricum TaxID=29290 RepID=A0A0F3GMZ7_9BACT|nr:hypothetical protein MBAV_004545 [Candidatus Magnetobacterium bavaricum]